MAAQVKNNDFWQLKYSLWSNQHFFLQEEALKNDYITAFLPIMEMEEHLYVEYREGYEHHLKYSGWSLGTFLARSHLNWLIRLLR